MAYGYSKGSGRYTNLETGRYVPRDIIFGELNGDVQQFRATAERLAQDLQVSPTAEKRSLINTAPPGAFLLEKYFYYSAKIVLSLF